MRILILFALVIITACTSTKTEEVKKINTEEMHALISEDQEIQIVDLRTSGEIAQGFIGNPIFINFSEGNFEERISKLDKGKPIVIYCASGGRSGRASEIIEKIGFKAMYDYTDGFNGWKSAEKQINKD